MTTEEKLKRLSDAVREHRSVLHGDGPIDHDYDQMLYDTLDTIEGKEVPDREPKDPKQKDGFETFDDPDPEVKN